MSSVFRSLLISLFPVMAWGATPTILNQPQVLQYAQNKILHVGVLERTQNGLLYLKVSNDYIGKILPLMTQKTVVAPPYFSGKGIGAHISVILPGEIDWSNPPELPGKGTEVPFDIVSFASVAPEAQPGAPYTKNVKMFYLFLVNAPALESIRIAAGLSPKIQGHDFHITVGVEYQ